MLKDILGHDDIKESLKVLKSNLPSLLLLSGPRGVGKRHTALNLIDELYTGSLSKRLLEHPDILILVPETKTFKLELIDSLKDFISSTAFEIDKKFVILANADLMNKESANACLKIFEDSPLNTHFILLAENEEFVIDTIKSRSTHLRLKPIRDLKKYIPNLSDIELKMMSGCIGKKKTLDEIGVDSLFQKVTQFLTSFSDLKYSDIIDWYLENQKIDIAILNSVFILSAQELCKSNRSLNTSLLFLKSCKEFNDKTNFSIKLDMHFKNMLLQNRLNKVD